jgi:cytochrome c biogenesis protein CcmG, thiol:disulfide interchange protein DsbE
MRLARLIRLLLLGLLGSALACNRASAAPVLGEPAPPLVLTGLDGKTIDLAKLRGKVVLINYWATWCAPCKVEMPTLNAFFQRYHDRGLEIIGISVDFQKDIEKVPRAAKALAYPVALLSAITDNGFGPPEGVPLTYVIDVDGVVRDKFIAAPDKLLHDVVVPMLPR